MNKCKWAYISDLDMEYHDLEWGKPVYDDNSLFEILSLECMQSGLSWSTILKKRENFRKAFDRFDIKLVEQYNEDKIEQLMNNEGIIRHRLKIKAIINNAKCISDIKKEYESFSNYIWLYVDNKPIINMWSCNEDVPSSSSLSDLITKDLKKRGFKFVGSTTVYSFMQACGMVDDHLIGCRMLIK
ncbi:MAG: DNA-3-methyladenine glycosylase I [Erysipelotrichales bacterium]